MNNNNLSPGGATLADRWGRLIAESFVAESLGDGFEGDGLVVQVDPVDSVQAGATDDSATKRFCYKMILL